jgi:serine/threonine protein kinase
VVFGSPKYATPETLQRGEGSEDCEPNDSYALGFMFYEILLGRKLFEAEFHDVYQQGEFAWLIWHADKSLRAKSLSELIEGFPHALSVLIEGMMMKDTAARTKDLRAVRNILANALQVTRVYSGPAPEIGLPSSQTDDASIHLVTSYLLTHICSLSTGRAVQMLWTWMPPVAQQTIRAGVIGVSSRIQSLSVKVRRSLVLYISKRKKECV